MSNFHRLQHVMQNLRFLELFSDSECNNEKTFHHVLIYFRVGKSFLKMLYLLPFCFLVSITSTMISCLAFSLSTYCICQCFAVSPLPLVGDSGGFIWRGYFPIFFHENSFVLVLLTVTQSNSLRHPNWRSIGIMVGCKTSHHWFITCQHTCQAYMYHYFLKKKPLQTSSLTVIPGTWLAALAAQQRRNIFYLLEVWFLHSMWHIQILRNSIYPFLVYIGFHTETYLNAFVSGVQQNR